MTITPVLLSEQPFNSAQPHGWTERGLWPAKWIAHPDAVAPIVVAYKCAFSLSDSAKFRLHVSADERYQLFLNGELVRSGPERGDGENWFFESLDVELDAGEHVFVARVWSLGDKSPFAQMSVKHGFLLAVEGEDAPDLNTGSAPWSTKILSGYEWQSPLCNWGTGWNQIVRGENFDWNHERGDGDDWIEPKIGVPGARAGSQHEASTHHRLQFAMLPPMLDELKTLGNVRHVAAFESRPIGETSIRAADSFVDEARAWQNLLSGEESLIVPPHTRRRVIVDLENYFCARPELLVSGGANSRVDIHWAESLFEDLQTWTKGRRSEIEGRYFTAHWNREDGVGDTFFPCGAPNRAFSTLWWQAGRYVQILVETGDEALTIHSLKWRETRYPLEMEGTFASSNENLSAMIPIMVRGLQMCSHETYMDCPYFEQLMYVGDTRLEVLTTYALTRDDRLPKKALKLFDWSRVLSGLTQSRYPSRARQIIPPFSLWWVAMCHDYALWRGETEFTKSLLPGVRAVCDTFAGLIDERGLMRAPDGWNFTDWVPVDEARKKDEGDVPWRNGVPAQGGWGVSGILNWHAALVFKLAGELESWFGESEIAALQTRRAQELAHAVDEHFWNEESGIYADTLAHDAWSEHAQCLALLSGFVPIEKKTRVAQGLLSAPDLARTTIYFTHYLFETYRQLGEMDAFFNRLQLWQSLVDNDLKTTIEMPEPTRSDCHAWGAHPLFHFYATLAGIRPIAPAFSRVEVKPQLGNLSWLEATMPHPRGEIRVSVREGNVKCELPDGVERV